nr:hypothetical protein WG33_0062 [uncultured bacterium]
MPRKGKVATKAAIPPIAAAQPSDDDLSELLSEVEDDGSDMEQLELDMKAVAGMVGRHAGAPAGSAGIQAVDAPRRVL